MPSVDFSKFSDADLDAIARGNMKKVSDEGLQMLANPPEKTEAGGLLGAMAEKAAAIPKKLDDLGKYTRAPLRSAISAGVDAYQNPNKNAADVVGDGLRAAGRQWGKDQSLAPTGTAIADKVGVSADPVVPGIPEGLGKLSLLPGALGDVVRAISPTYAPTVGNTLGAPRNQAVGKAIDVGADLLNVPAAIGAATKVGTALNSVPGMSGVGSAASEGIKLLPFGESVTKRAGIIGRATQAKPIQVISLIPTANNADRETGRPFTGLPMLRRLR